MTKKNEGQSDTKKRVRITVGRDLINVQKFREGLRKVQTIVETISAKLSDARTEAAEADALADDLSGLLTRISTSFNDQVETPDPAPDYPPPVDVPPPAVRERYNVGSCSTCGFQDIDRDDHSIRKCRAVCLCPVCDHVNPDDDCILWQYVGPVDASLRGIVDQVVKEYYRAADRYSDFVNGHEGYAVLNEELDELWDEIKKQPRDRDVDLMSREAVQVAAMAIRFIVDVCGGYK